MPFTQIAVTFTFAPNGVPARGEVVATLLNEMVDGAGLISPAGPRPGVRLDRNGHGSITVDANDDTTTQPAGTAYQFTAYLWGFGIHQDLYVIPHTAAGGTIDLAQLAPALPANPVYGYALQSALTAGLALAAQRAANLSDLASAAAARTNLGLGSAATHPSTDFDAAGAASAAAASRARPMGAWGSGTAYVVNDVVTRSGDTFRALAPSTNVDPVGNPGSWEPWTHFSTTVQIGAGVGFNPVVAAGTPPAGPTITVTTPQWAIDVAGRGYWLAGNAVPSTFTAAVLGPDLRLYPIGAPA